MSVHTFEPAVAKQYGLVEAVLIRNFQFWIAHNYCNGKHEHDGHTWTYNSVRAMQDLFPYLSKKSISGALTRLQESGVLLVGNYNEHAYDRTQWYAFADQDKWILPEGEKHLPKKENGDTQKVTPIPDGNTDSNTDSKQVPAQERGGTFIVGNDGNIVVPETPAAPAKGEKKPAAKKQPEPKATKPARPHWQQLVDGWHDWYKLKHAGEEPNFRGRNPAFFGQLVDLLHGRAEKKAKRSGQVLEWTSGYAIKALLYYLELAWSDTWLKGHFLLSNLVDQFDAVYAREALRTQAEKEKRTPPPPTAQSGTEGELQYIRARYKEGTLDPRMITPDIYDKLTSRGYLPVGSMNNFPAPSHEESKVLAVKYWLDLKTKSTANETE